MNFLNTALVLSTFLPLCASFEGFIRLNASHDQCDCCPWKLIQVVGCDHPSNASFHEADLTLRFYLSDSAVKHKFNNLTSKRFSLVGIGTGLRHSYPYQCTPDSEDTEWHAWSINTKTLPVVKGTMEPWERFSEKVIETLKDEMANSSATIPRSEIELVLQRYQFEVFRRFERFNDCGKLTVDGERRCVHLVISPLAHDYQSHREDFLPLSINTSQVGDKSF